ncbi:MAG: hypothetical protein AB7P03_13545 [Kofleriaceae bacterium]
MVPGREWFAKLAPNLAPWLVLCLALGAEPACGRSQGISDQELGNLVISPKPPEHTVTVDQAANDPVQLGAALQRPHRDLIAALGPHTTTIATTTTVSEADKQVSELSDEATIEVGNAGSYHAVYTNSADYGRETIFVGDTMFLRPRYQRWNSRPPEAADEPDAARDAYFDAIAATWDLIAPAAELTDQGPAQIAGRAGRKIVIKLKPGTARMPTEALAQRKWRETRTIDELSGEVVLDVEKAVPLAVKLAGTIGFTRDGRRFRMKTSVQSTVTALGAVAIAAPEETEVVATPERRREVDDRDYLLQGIAPPLIKNRDGTAATPQPLDHKAARKSPAKSDDKPAKSSDVKNAGSASAQGGGSNR